MSKKAMKNKNSAMEKRLARVERENKPLSRVHRIISGPQSSGWQKDHERIAEVIVDRAGGYLCSVVQRIQPGLESFAPWMAETLGQGWVKYLIRALEFMFVTDVPTTVAGNLILGWLPDATARLPSSMVEAAQSAVYVSGNINDGLNLRIPKSCLEDAFGEDTKYTRQGMVEGDPNLYDAGVFFVASEGYNEPSGPSTGNICVGFIDMKVDVAFHEKQIPRNLLTVGDGFNSEWTYMLGFGTGAAASPIGAWTSQNNNPADWMVNDLTPGELYVPPGIFICHLTCSATSIGSSSLEWFAQTSIDSTIVPPPAFSASLVPGSIHFRQVITSTDLSGITTVTFLVNNQDNRVVPNLPTTTANQFRTGMRLRVQSIGATFFEIAPELQLLLVRRLPTEGAVGLDGVGQETSNLTRFLTSMQRYNAPVKDLKGLLDRSRLAIAAQRKNAQLPEPCTSTSKNSNLGHCNKPS